jgi:cell division protein FtsQ
LAISITQRAETRSAADTTLARRRIPTVRGPLLFIVCASAAVLVGGLLALSRSSLFALRHLEVTGAGHVSAAEIRSLAGVSEGANVVWLDASAVERRLASDPWIARASVDRSFPWGITIHVAERTPVAVVSSGADRAGSMIAGDGTRLGRAPDRSRLPRIELPPAAPATVGMPGESGAVRALAAMSPSVLHRVREVDIAIGGTLTLRLRGGATVDLGPAVDLDAKVRVLRRLLAWEHRTGTALGRLSVVAPTAPAATIAG